MNIEQFKQLRIPQTPEIFINSMSGIWAMVDHTMKNKRSGNVTVIETIILISVTFLNNSYGISYL